MVRFYKALELPLYASENPLGQSPRFKCQVEPVDDNLLDYLVAELITCTVITSIFDTPEAHKRVYIYATLLAIVEPVY